MDKPKKTFYRRVLPDSCVAFASPKGKQLFTEALPTGYMNCYFSLASQFRTQEEPAYCGFSSLVMVLNALAVDPGVVWKGVFRWYHEDMLDCCTPLEEAKVKGVTMENLFCLALCNQLDGEMKRADENACLNSFREEIKEATSQDIKAMIISYGRNVLGQTGTGHFSPVGGYNEKEDMVLILDVARFKYPPYWVHLPKLWEAMKSPDTETGLPRGYLILWRAQQGIIPEQPPLLFKVSKRLNAFRHVFEEVGTFLKQINKMLEDPVKETTDEDVLNTILKAMLATSAPRLTEHASAGFLSLKVTESQLKEVVDDEAELFQLLIRAIEETSLFGLVVKLVPSDVCCGRALFGVNEGDCNEGCQSSLAFHTTREECIVCLPHFLTVFLLSFPLNHGCGCNKKEANTDRQTYMKFLKKLIDKELDELDCPRNVKTKPEVEQKKGLLVNEVKQLRRQFSALISTPRLE